MNSKCNNISYDAYTIRHSVGRVKAFSAGLQHGEGAREVLHGDERLIALEATVFNGRLIAHSTRNNEVLDWQTIAAGRIFATMRTHGGNVAVGEGDFAITIRRDDGSGLVDFHLFFAKAAGAVRVTTNGVFDARFAVFVFRMGTIHNVATMTGWNGEVNLKSNQTRLTK